MWVNSCQDSCLPELGYEAGYPKYPVANPDHREREFPQITEFVTHGEQGGETSYGRVAQGATDVYTVGVDKRSATPKIDLCPTY